MQNDASNCNHLNRGVAPNVAEMWWQYEGDACGFRPKA
jgi:hypothetical protein